MSKTLKEIMSAKVSQLVLTSSVETCGEGVPLREVVEQIRKAGVGSIIVVKEGRPVGIFTERDYIKKIACNRIDKSTAVSKFMTPNPISVTVSEPIGKVLIMMRMGRFRHIVVVHEDGRLKNIISIKDVLDFLLDAVGECK